MTLLETPAPLRPSFKRINKTVFLHSSPSSSTPTSHPFRDPDTIILLSWGAAPFKPIAKYTTRYETLYPNARILLITTSFADIIFHTESSQKAILAPAVDLLRATPNGKTLVHIFSNGGSYKLRELALAYRRTAGHALPIDALIIDSAPGRPHFHSSAAAIKTVLPEPWPLWILSVVLMYAYLLSMKLWHGITGRRAISQLTWEALNDAEVIDPKARRMYVASRSDEMILFEDVEAHVEDARKRGCRARLEKFVGSRHVAHAVVDGERYWRLVRELWEQSMLRRD